jgi:hypothetical protein
MTAHEALREAEDLLARRVAALCQAVRTDEGAWPELLEVTATLTSVCGWLHETATEEHGA